MVSGMKLFILLVLFFFFQLSSMRAQADFGLILGISNYQGDLASHSTENGFKALIGPVVGVYSGYELNYKFRLRADLLYTRLAGDDAFSEKEENRSRNLD